MRNNCRLVAVGLLVGAQVLAGETAPRHELRQYRADATVLLLGIRIFSKEGVGSGFSAIDEVQNGPTRVVSLRFAAGSWPEKARGLNRLGFIEEAVEMSHTLPRRVDYFGVMTSSDEKSLDEAKQALRTAGSRKSIPYSVMRGLIQPGSFAARKTRFHSTEGYSWSEWTALLPQARAAIKPLSVDGPTAALSHPGSEMDHPLLYTLVQLMGSDETQSVRRFVWGEHIYRIETKRQSDPGMGKALAAKSLTPVPERIVRLDGHITNPKTGGSSKFRLWFEEGALSVLPLRIEYKPRSFLRLVFEAEPGPSLPQDDSQGLATGWNARATE